MTVLEPFRHEHFHGLTHHFLSFVTKQNFSLGIHHHNAAILADHYHGAWRNFGDLIENLAPIEVVRHVMGYHGPLVKLHRYWQRNGTGCPGNCEFVRPGWDDGLLLLVGNVRNTLLRTGRPPSAINVVVGPHGICADHIQAVFIDRFIFIISALYRGEISWPPVKLHPMPLSRRNSCPRARRSGVPDVYHQRVPTARLTLSRSSLHAHQGAFGGVSRDGVEFVIAVAIFGWQCRPRRRRGRSVDRGQNRLPHRFRLRLDRAEHGAQAGPQIIHLIE